jgi:hypothetical protein
MGQGRADGNRNRAASADGNHRRGAINDTVAWEDARDSEGGDSEARESGFSTIDSGDGSEAGTRNKGWAGGGGENERN